MPRRRVDPQLGWAFITGASSWYRRNHKPACWLRQFDLEGRPCTYGPPLEGVHLISRQRIRNVLRDQMTIGPDFLDCFSKEEVDDLVEAAEWDSRNGALGCEEHHRRFDSHMTPRLVVPVSALPLQMLAFILDWGLEAEAERKFDSTDATLTEVFDIRSNLLERHWGYAHAA